MNSTEFIEVVGDGASESSPQISPEAYQELVVLRQRMIELKAQKSDVQDFVIIGQRYASQLSSAQEQLQALVDQINEASANLQSRLKELVEPYGITGEFSISDTAPHWISESASTN